MTVSLTAPIVGIGAASIAAFKELDDSLTVSQLLLVLQESN